MRGIHFALVLGLIASVAHAQDSGETDRIAEARRAYADGAEAFGAGRFGRALDRFTRAYELAPRAELLYNIGTAHDRLGHDRHALEAYRDYLEATPDAQNRDYTEARIRVLEDRVADADDAEADDAEADDAEADDAEADDAEADAEADADAERSANVPAIVLLATAGGAVLGAAISGGLALAQHSDLEDACSMGACTPDQQTDLDRLDRLTRTTDVLIGLAAAAAITGIILLIVGGTDDDSRVAISPLGVRVSL